VLPISFTILPPETNTEGNLIVEACLPDRQAYLLPKRQADRQAQVGNRVVQQGMITINYSHIPIQTLFPPSEVKLIRLNIKKVINNIGYIMGPGDDVPQSLGELGYNVKMLNINDIGNSELSKYDAIITGVRAYNTLPELNNIQPELMEYVKNGGTLVVQYNKNFDLITDKIGPYPFHISNQRVTDENSDINFIDPESSLLNFPNKITKNDFDGWIQERGIYFGLIYTRYGKGIFIYTGYDWFRELPSGVPGAYKIFVNLISAAKAPSIVN
jgi:hypothetical protein